MKKDDLKCGMIVELRNGTSCIFYGKELMYPTTGLIRINHFNNSLKHILNNNSDIVKVFEPKLIWKREKEETINIDGKEISKSTVKIALKQYFDSFNIEE